VEGIHVGVCQNVVYCLVCPFLPGSIYLNPGEMTLHGCCGRPDDCRDIPTIQTNDIITSTPCLFDGIPVTLMSLTPRKDGSSTPTGSRSLRSGMRVSGGGSHVIFTARVFTCGLGRRIPHTQTGTTGLGISGQASGRLVIMRTSTLNPNQNPVTHDHHVHPYVYPRAKTVLSMHVRLDHVADAG
jgi:hypothetical protein